MKSSKTKRKAKDKYHVYGLNSKSRILFCIYPENYPSLFHSFPLASLWDELLVWFRLVEIRRTADVNTKDGLWCIFDIALADSHELISFEIFLFMQLMYKTWNNFGTFESRGRSFSPLLMCWLWISNITNVKIQSRAPEGGRLKFSLAVFQSYLQVADYCCRSFKLSNQRKKTGAQHLKTRYLGMLDSIVQ